MKDLLEKNGILMYSTENEEKSSVVERWNRTIKYKMWKQFTVQGNTQYLDMLHKILKQYNNTKHSSVKMTPTEASKKRNEGTVYFNLYGDMEPLSAKPKFKVGDKVRISKYKRNVFDKGYTPNWTEEVFTVDKMQYTNPRTNNLKMATNQGDQSQPPRKSVKEMVQAYEDDIILPPVEFRDGYKPIPKPRTKKPVPSPRTKIEQVNNALNGYTKSFEIGIKHNKDPLVQLQNTRKALEHHIISILTSMKGLKFVETLMMTFTKTSDSGIVYKTAYFNGAAQTIVNNPEVTESLQSSQQHILNKIAQWVSEGSGWTIQSVDNHYLNIVKYQPLKGSSYIELPDELRNSAKGLINMKNKDNECFRWCHIRHWNPQNKDPQRIKRSDKEYINRLDYSGIEFPVTTKQYNKIEKTNNIRINVFGYEEKKPYPIYIYQKKNLKIIWSSY